MAFAIVLKTASDDLTAHTRSEIMCKDKWRRTGDGNKQRRRCGMLEKCSRNKGGERLASGRVRGNDLEDGSGGVEHTHAQPNGFKDKRLMNHDYIVEGHVIILIFHWFDCVFLIMTWWPIHIC